MVKGSTIALVGIGGLVAADATGIIGGGGGNQESPLPPVIPGSGSGADLGEVAALMQSKTGESVTRVINTGEGSAGMGASIAQAMAQMQDSQNETLATVMQATSGGDGGGNPTVPDTPNWRDYVPGSAGPDTSSSDPGNTGGSGPGGYGITPRQKAAYQSGRDPFGLQATTKPGSPVGKAAESLRAAGDTVTDVAGAPTDAAKWAGKSGRTFGESINLLTTGSADTSGTFQEGRGEVGLDFSGDGEAGGKLTDRLPDMKLDQGTKDAMLAGLL